MNLPSNEILGLQAEKKSFVSNSGLLDGFLGFKIKIRDSEIYRQESPVT